MRFFTMQKPFCGTIKFKTDKKPFSVSEKGFFSYAVTVEGQEAPTPERMVYMSEKRRLAILGGDERQISMARALAEVGFPVSVWGLGACGARIGKAVLCEAWQEAIAASQVVILPLPATADGVRLHCPLQNSDVLLRMTTLLDVLPGHLLLGGRLGESVRNIAELKKIEWVDYFDSEILQIKNALPTAEGAISIAMQELPVTLHGTEAAVIGYGRIGSILAGLLESLGAHVTVYARRGEQLAQAELHRHHSARLICRGGGWAPEKISSECRVIFNTVPQWIFTEEVLQGLPAGCLLIDLASAPGGIDRAAAERLGVRSIWGTALPGKYAPESAGRILAETVIHILEDFTPTRR